MTTTTDEEMAALGPDSLTVHKIQEESDDSEVSED